MTIKTHPMQINREETKFLMREAKTRMEKWMGTPLSHSQVVAIALSHFYLKVLHEEVPQFEAEIEQNNGEQK